MIRAAALCLVAFLGCSSGIGTEEPAPGTPAAAPASAIVKIVTRDRTITLSAGRGSVRATVLDANGGLLARDVDIDALQTIDARAYDVSHSSFANRGSGGEKGPAAQGLVDW